ncbi:MAG: HEAT repeat domain-containing protein [Polyangiaceae bacterium]
MKWQVVLMTVALCAASASAVAAERGVILAPSDLSANHVSALRKDVEAHRVAHPEAFTRVQQVLSTAAQADAHRRGNFASVTRGLDALGGDALLPMLEQLALKGMSRGSLSPTAWLAVRVSLIESVGRKRDARAIPVLERIVDKEQDYWVLRAAAEGLGRIGTDAAAAKLVSLVSKAGPRRRAVLSALGDCRRAVIVSTLDKLLNGKLEYEERRLALAALGDAGNSWAWQTPAVRSSGEEAVVRSGAAKILVSAFVRHHQDEVLRSEIQKSLLLVEDASTPGLIEAAKSGASPALAARLDALKQKYQRFIARKSR